MGRPQSSPVPQGTAHIEVHPDVAWRLNSIWRISIPGHPGAVPPATGAQAEERPVDPAAAAVLGGRLSGDRQATYRLVKTDDFRNPYRKELVRHAVDFERYDREKAGNTRAPKPNRSWSHWGREVCRGLVSVRLRSVLRVGGGCGIGLRSRSARHQFYPTPAALAARAVELAEIGPRTGAWSPARGPAIWPISCPRTERSASRPRSCAVKCCERKAMRSSKAIFSVSRAAASTGSS